MLSRKKTRRTMTSTLQSLVTLVDYIPITLYNIILLYYIIIYIVYIFTSAYDSSPRSSLWRHYLL